MSNTVDTKLIVSGAFKKSFLPRTSEHLDGSVSIDCWLLEQEVMGSNQAAAPYQRCKNGMSGSLADARIKKGLC